MCTPRPVRGRDRPASASAAILEDVEPLPALASLELAGNETRTAHDGEEGVRLAASWQPHVVLLDIGMPRLNGYDACRAMRAQAGGRDMQIIAITGWGQADDRRKSEAAGFDAHLVKPVDFLALAASLEDLSGRVRPRAPALDRAAE